MAYYIGGEENVFYMEGRTLCKTLLLCCFSIILKQGLPSEVAKNLMSRPSLDTILLITSHIKITQDLTTCSELCHVSH